MPAQRVATTGPIGAVFALGCQTTASKSDVPTDSPAVPEAKFDATDAPPDSSRLSGWTVAGKPVSVN